VRERAGRDGEGKFVGISCDEESPVAAVDSSVEKSAVDKKDAEEDAASVHTQEEELAKQEEDQDMN